MLSFVSGGVRSGKSTFAERHVAALQGARKIYLATAIPFDEEMAARIGRHRAMRAGDGWTTLEVPYGPFDALSALQSGDSVLLDCATVWLTNLMFGTPPARFVQEIAGAQEQLPALMLEDIMAASRRVSRLVVVSNDVFCGLYDSYDSETKRYITLLGEFHCRLAAAADEVWECISGIPIRRKLQEGDRE